MAGRAGAGRGTRRVAGATRPTRRVRVRGGPSCCVEDARLAHCESWVGHVSMNVMMTRLWKLYSSVVKEGVGLSGFESPSRFGRDS